MHMETLASPQNPRVKQWRLLNKSRGERLRQGLFLAEGEHMAQEAVRTGWAATLLTLDERLERYHDLIEAARARGTECLAVTRGVLSALSDTKTPQGVLAVCRLPDLGEAEHASFTVALNGVQDPGNVGTVLRTLDAVGDGRLWIDRDCADPFSPKALRASMGAVFRVPVTAVVDLPARLLTLQSEGATVLAGALDGEPFYARPKDGERVCVVIGNEGAGISPKVLAAAGRRVRLPMHGGAESLNAAVSCAVMLYDVLRRREEA
ncbi:MAG: RNA methyltransferase [Clostridia bacterium]|nr:RNA methyltransferase [Clostridia bacterium]